MDKMIGFAVVICTIVMLVHFYVGRRLISPSGMKKPLRVAAWITLYIMAFLLLAGPVMDRIYTSPPKPMWLNALIWVSFTQMGIMVLVFLGLLIKDLFRLGKKLYQFSNGKFKKTEAGEGEQTEDINISRRTFMINGANLGIIGASTGLAGFGAGVAIGEPTIERVSIEVNNLPAGLEGMKIAQISDMHIGPTLKRDFTEMVVRTVNELKPDIIAVTGDLIDGYVDVLKHDTEPFKDLSAKYGTYYVTGNHEYYWGVRPWLKEVERLGMTVLSNESRIISTSNGDLLLAGVTDYESERFTPDEASSPLKAISQNQHKKADYKILLAHQPRSCFEAAKVGFNLQLSGHTHGGQFVPWNYLVKLQQPFVEGLDLYKDLLVYTNRGTGYWGPPIRIGVPSEISLLTLVSKKA